MNYFTALENVHTECAYSELEIILDRMQSFNPLTADLNPILHLLKLLGAHHIFHVSELRVNSIPLFIYLFVYL
jgi:hypothetical protein